MVEIFFGERERERRKSIENQKINSVKNNTDENNCIYIQNI